MTLEATIIRREQIRFASRRYRFRNLEKVREYARAYDAARPEAKKARDERFAANNPTYWRDYQRKRRFRLAWLKFTKACAASRARTSRPVGVG